MHDPGPVLLSSGSLAGEAVNEGARGMACARMDDDARRLVHHEQVLVLVRDPERHLLGLDRGRSGLDGLELDLLPTFQPVALRPPGAVDQHGAAGQQTLSRRTRADLGQLGQETVEPRPGRLVGNADSQETGRGGWCVR